MTRLVAGLVPAAGASRRMAPLEGIIGSKLLLPFRGGTLLGAVLEALRGGGVDPIALVAPPDDPGLTELASREGLLLAINPRPERGMLSTIQVGVEALQAADPAGTLDYLAVCPGDLPLLAAETVAQLLAAARGGGALLAVPTHLGRRGHPLLVARRLWLEIFALDPAIGLRQLLERRADEILELPTADGGVLADVDTPEEYRETTRW